jgi:hypothetical protein
MFSLAGQMLQRSNDKPAGRPVESLPTNTVVVCHGPPSLENLTIWRKSMLSLLKALRQDESGVILSTELAIVGSVLVVGVMTGMSVLKESVNTELGELSSAINSIDQSYSFSGHRKAYRIDGNSRCHAFTAGSTFQNNDCDQEVAQQNITGPEDQTPPHADVAGVCGSCDVSCQASLGCGPCNGLSIVGGGCNSCSGSANTGGVCGSCGGSCRTGAACNSCGAIGYGFGDTNRPDCFSTGVQKMKVTEYPGTSNVPRTSNEGMSPIRFPELDDQSYTGEFGQSHRQLSCLICPPAVNVEEILPEPTANESAPATADAVNNDADLRPVPENQPLPETPPGETKE